MDKTGLRDFYVDVASFSTLINAGCAMVRCLHLLGENGCHPDTREFIPQVEEKVAGGETLTRALVKSGSEYWSAPIVITLVRAGEVGGVLDETLDRLANFYLAKLQGNAKSERAQAIWLFGTLIESGVPVLQACESVSGSFESEAIKLGFMEAKDILRGGGRLGDCERIVDFLGPIIMQMMAIGEECGCVDAMCFKAADLLDIMNE
jgi:type II secretory pathway component PulF